MMVTVASSLPPVQWGLQRAAVGEGDGEVLVRLINGVVGDGNGDVPYGLEAELAAHIRAGEVASGGR